VLLGKKKKMGKWTERGQKKAMEGGALVRNQVKMVGGLSKQKGEKSRGVGEKLCNPGFITNQGKPKTGEKEQLFRPKCHWGHSKKGRRPGKVLKWKKGRPKPKPDRAVNAAKGSPGTR